MKNVVIRILGFAVGVVIVLAAEFLLFQLLQIIFDTRLRPRGAGWALIPIMAGIGLASVSPQLVQNLPQIFAQVKKWFVNSQAKKVIIVFALWVFIVGSFVAVFEPYGYMYSDDYVHMYKVMLFPPVVLSLIYFVWKRFLAK